MSESISNQYGREHFVLDYDVSELVCPSSVKPGDILVSHHKNKLLIGQCYFITKKHFWLCHLVPYLENNIRCHYNVKEPNVDMCRDYDIDKYKLFYRICKDIDDVWI